MGKTSLYKLLTGLKFDPDQKSTCGIDNKTVRTVERRCVGMEQELKEVPPEYQLNQQLATRVVARLGTVTEQNISGLMTEEELHRRINGLTMTLHSLTMTPPPSPGVEAQSSDLTMTRSPSPGVEVQSSDLTMTRSPSPGVEAQSSDLTMTRSPSPGVEAQSSDLTMTRPPSPGVEAQSSDLTMTRPPSPGVEAQSSGMHPVEIPAEQQQPLDIDRAVSNLISYKLNHPNQGFEPSVYLNMYDFAGQRAYVPMHHCFIVRRAIYLVVFNLQLLLEGNSGDSKPIEGIRYWLNSISMYLPVPDEDKQSRRVFLVGTHRACITEEQLLDIDVKLCDEFHHMDANIRYVDCSFSDKRKSAIFSPVENSLDGKGNWKASGAKYLHEELMKICCSEKHRLDWLNDDYPVVWLDFERKLLSERRKRSNVSKIVKWEKVEELAQCCSIGSRKELETAVQFFHDTGTIICSRKFCFSLHDPNNCWCTNLAVLRY